MEYPFLLRTDRLVKAFGTKIVNLVALACMSNNKRWKFECISFEKYSFSQKGRCFYCDPPT
jgi:site-specific DNA-adenine methylase